MDGQRTKIKAVSWEWWPHKAKLKKRTAEGDKKQQYTNKQPK